MIFIPNLEQLDITQEVWDHVTEMAKQRQIDDEVLLDVQHRASQLRRWDVVYAISYLAGLETSVLIDAEEVISIDWDAKDIPLYAGRNSHGVPIEAIYRMAARWEY